MRDELTKLKNIGETTADWLMNIGIERPEQIEELGAIVVYLRLKEKYPVTRNALWALQGAILNISYTQISDDMKQALLAKLDE